MEQICVLGGTGFVGSWITNRLCDAGYRVRIPTRRRYRHTHLLVQPEVELVAANINDPGVLEQVLEGCDAVINLVGILNEMGRSRFAQSHAAIPRALAAACHNQRVMRVVHMSALNADAQQGASKYLRSKGEGEDVLFNAEGLQVTSFRPSVIFGPGDSFFNRFATLVSLMPGVFPLAGAKTKFAPVFVDDVAHAFMSALENPATIGERYELCGPNTYTLKELVAYTATNIGQRCAVLPLPKPVAMTQALMMEFVPGKPLTRDNLRSMTKDSVCGGLFPEIFGIQPQSIEDVVPNYLGIKERNQQLQQFRESARR